MKIGIVCYPTFGGSGIVATEIGKYLAKLGNEIHFISYKRPARLDFFSPNIQYHQVNIDEYPLFKYQPYETALCSKIIDVTIQHKLNLIHAHYAIPHAYATYMAIQILKQKDIYIPFVTTLHGTDITLVGKNPSYKNVVTFSIEQSNIVTCVSESLKKDTYQYFDIKKKIKVVPNFIDLEKYKYLNSNHQCRRKVFAQDNEKLIIHISNFREVKRTQDVLKVFHLIQKKIKSKLLLIGEGPQKEKLATLAKELGIYHLIYFIGNTSQIESPLYHSDLFLMCSKKESFGLAALEAMAAKTPVISTNIGGIPEINKHGITGYLSPIGAVKDMANNAINLLKDENILKTFKQNAFEHSKKFDIKNVLPLYENIYQSILN